MHKHPAVSEKVKILCVDDESNVLKAIERLFLDTDYEIITASSGEEGLEVIKNTDGIQLVISDYRMPRMNGVDFLKEVYSKKSDIVRIVLSGYADTSTIVEAVNEGQIYKFIPKPWNDDDLKVTIANALDHYFTNQKIIQLAVELESRNKELQEINSNLEKIVNERTADILRQNKVLTCSQNILDSLPVAVIGVDPEGLVVQCNRKGLDIFELDEGNILGLDRFESFPEEINRLIDSVLEKREVSKTISKNGSSLIVKGVHMKHAGGQEGIILVLDEEGDSQ